MTPVAEVDRTYWETLFQPVIDAGSISGNAVGLRPQQTILGQSVIDAFATKTPLVAESPTGTGKSLGYLIPLIHAVSGEDNEKRGIVSTETIALQDQIALKDLPFLESIYPDFTYKLLKGRSNYVCLENADYNSRGNTQLIALVKQLQMHVSRLGDGEKRDVEKILGREIDDKTWSFIAGSMQFCGENSCDISKCFSTRARAAAGTADIVVINHALLQAHIDSGYALLGQIDYAVIDEAHSLEQVLVSGWTESISEWELTEKHGAITKGLDKSRRGVDVDPSLMYATETALDAIHVSLASVLNFYGTLYKDQEWRNLSEALSEKTVFGNVDARTLKAMEKFEVDIPHDLTKAAKTLEQVKKHLERAVHAFEDQDIKGRRELKKGLTATKHLLEFCELVTSSLKTKDGVVVDYGVPYGVIVDGFERRNGDAGVRIRTVPLDISSKLAQLWTLVSPVLISATLTDLTDGSFKYLTASLGYPEHEVIQTGSPFDYQLQQRTYITQATEPVVDVIGARYSFDELVDLIEHASGRTLVLFTSRKEMDDAADRLYQLQARGEFNWPILVQSKDANKQKLVNEFRTVKHSVLLASKGMMTGVDFPGDTCSLVVLVKFPLPRYDVVCRQQMAWWLRRGFGRWYEREALTVFQQAAGRLIRTGTDRGVVAILDQRVVNPGERVFQTARVGVTALGSSVIRTPLEVQAFLGETA